MADPSEVQGKGIEILKNSGIDVTLGVLKMNVVFGIYLLTTS